ncbi:MAG: hypothetical protein NVSMB1_20740 [Polyangiales bacterium]
MLLDVVPLATMRDARAEATAADIAVARELFVEGLKLEERRRWSEALSAFRRVAAVRTSPAVRFHIALCLENSGRLVEAQREFDGARVDVGDDPNSDAQLVATRAAKHSDDLRLRIPQIVLRLPSDVPTAIVEIDGAAAPVALSAAGSAFHLNPGVHHLRVEAEGRLSFRKEIDLQEKGEPLTIDLNLPRKAPDEPSGKGLPEAVSRGSQADPPVSAAPSTKGPWVYIVGGVGVASLVGSGIAFGLRASSLSKLASNCPNSQHCSDVNADLYQSTRTYTTLGNVLAGVGAAGLVAAAVIFLVTPSDPNLRTGRSVNRANPGVVLRVHASPSWVGLVGSF